MIPSVAISTACSVLGDTCRNLSAADTTFGGELGSRLRKEGYEAFYVEESADPVAHCERAVARLESIGGFDPKEIGMVIFGSDLTLAAGRHEVRRRLAEFLKRFRLGHAYLLPTYLGECGNFSAALAVAAALVRDGRCDKILVVVSDTRGPRETPLPGPFLLSDSATAAVIERDRGLGLKLNHVLLENDLDMMHSRALYGLTRQNAVGAALVQNLRATRRVATAWREVLEPLVSQGAHFLLPNVFDAVNRTFCRELGVPAVLDGGTRREIAHAGAADILLTLAKGLGAGTLASGATIIALNSGMHVWNAFTADLGDMAYFQDFEFHLPQEREAV
jgi:3-oxoacyl-[acyl-carrier-protein] synthase III